MDLTTFTKQITTKFNNKVNYDLRIADAREIAAKYKFSPPELVLFVTHPEMARMNLRERCERLGITEESFMQLHSQDGYRRFLRDYKDLTKDVIEVQTLENISRTLSTERFIYDDEGSQLGADTRLEEKLYASQLQSTASAPSVNVQINNMWNQARARVKEDTPAITVTATRAPLPSQDNNE